MKFNSIERELNSKGHNLIAQGRALIAEAERVRSNRRRASDEAFQRQERERIEKLKRMACDEQSKNLESDIFKASIGYPGIIIDSVSRATHNDWSTGEIVIRFSKKP